MIIGGLDNQWFWKQGLTTTNAVQKAQAPHPQCTIEVIQRLIDRMWRLRRSQRPCSLEVEKNVGTCLIYRIDKGLSIIPVEVLDHIDLITV